MLEVEAKLRADAASVVALRARLDAAATFLGAAAQEDVFLAHPGRDLAGADEALRIRRVTATEPPQGRDGDGAGPDSWELTYKGPRLATAGGRGEGMPVAKAREELTVLCATDPAPLLERLGFVASARVRKRRRSYRWQQVTVALDEVEGLGSFIEVEAMATDRAAGEALVAHAVRALGLDGLPREAGAYVTLLSGTTPRRAP